MDEVLPELVRHFSSALLFIIAIFSIWLFRKPIGELLTKVGGVKAMGVELSFLEGSMEDADMELAEKFPGSTVRISDIDKMRVLNRVKRHLGVLESTEILWVDDHPENNTNEQRMFRRLEVGIDIAKSTQEALDILKNRHYDLVFSDMSRDVEGDSGLKFLEQFRAIDGATPVIFYIDKPDPIKGTPAGAFGITIRPDELLHLTLDALERRKYEKP